MYKVVIVVTWNVSSESLRARLKITLFCRIYQNGQCDLSIVYQVHLLKVYYINGVAAQLLKVYFDNGVYQVHLLKVYYDNGVYQVHLLKVYYINGVYQVHLLKVY